MEQNASEQELPGHQGSYKCGYGELEDGKESKEVEMSLLGEDGGYSSTFKPMESGSQTTGPLGIPKHLNPPGPLAPIFSSSPGIPAPTPRVQICNLTQPISDQTKLFPPLATPDPEIQLAEPESGKSSILVKTKSSVCGKNPVKLTTICLVALSMWVMVVLIMHLDKKMTAVTSSMCNVEDQLRTMEDTANTYRADTSHRLNEIQHKVGNILHSVRRKDGKLKKLHKASTPAYPTKEAILTFKYTKHGVTPTEHAKPEEELENEFFGDGWLVK